MFCHVVREELKDLTKDFDHSEEDLKSLQSGVGQIVGEVLRQLTEEKCEGSRDNEKYNLILLPIVEPGC